MSLTLRCLVSLVELLNDLGLVVLHPLEVDELLQVPIIGLLVHFVVTLSSLRFVTMLLLVKLVVSRSVGQLLLVLSLLLLSVVSLLGLGLQSEWLHRVLLGLSVGIRCGPCWVFLLQLRTKHRYMIFIWVLGVCCSSMGCFTSSRSDALVLSPRSLLVLVLRFS